MLLYMDRMRACGAFHSERGRREVAEREREGVVSEVQTVAVLVL